MTALQLCVHTALVQCEVCSCAYTTCAVMCAAAGAAADQTAAEGTRPPFALGLLTAGQHPVPGGQTSTGTSA